MKYALVLILSTACLPGKSPEIIKLEQSCKEIKCLVKQLKKDGEYWKEAEILIQKWASEGYTFDEITVKEEELSKLRLKECTEIETCN